MYKGIYKKNGYNCLNLECNNKTCRLNNFCRRCANLGPLNPNYKEDAVRRKKYYCIDCDKEITYQGALYGNGRCMDCANSDKKGKKKTEDFCIKLSKRMKKQWEDKDWKKKMVEMRKDFKFAIIKHHIDGNKLNNEESNILKIRQDFHRSLHWSCYDYLVEIGLVNDYLKEFMIEHDTMFFIDDGKLVHHIDGNRENNNLDNLLFLESRSLHNKLHQEAYQYLVKIKKIREYIDWFFKKKEIAT